MDFGAPWFLLLLPAVAFLGWLLVWMREQRRIAQVRFADPALLRAVASTERPGYAIAHIVLVCLAATLLVIGLARPRGGSVEEELTGEGIDIVFAMDISRSMGVDDLPPSRLEVMKAVAKAITDKNPTDRIGVVAFAGEAFVLCPLTLDHSTVKTFIDAQGFEPDIRQGTAIGDAITTSLDRFDSTNARVLILFTDGESNKGVDPIQAARAAAERGIRIYTVGIGSEQGAQLYEEGMGFHNVPRPQMHQGSPVVVGIDETTLREVAKITGGSFISIKDPSEVTTAFLQLDKSAKQAFSMGARSVKAELGPWFLAAAALLLWIDFLVELYRVSPLGFDWVRGRSRATAGSHLTGSPARQQAS